MKDQPLNEEGLVHLRAVNFDWVMHIKSIWSDAGIDLDSIQHTHRTKIATELFKLRNRSDKDSPLGLVVLGQAGSGKTHLLNVIRKYSLFQGIGFILVDMTGVHDFWGTVLQGYVSSLQVEIAGDETQLGQLVDFLLSYTDQSIDRRALAQASGPELNQYLKKTLTGLTSRDRSSTIRYQNVVRALVLLNSDELYFSSIGSNWLQGLQIDDRARSEFGFTVSIPSSLQNIVEGLSWVMSLRAPTVLAFDQLDSIVTQHHLAAGTRATSDLLDEQLISRAIIQGIGGGFTALHTATARTLTLVSCLEATWNILKQQALSSFLDRFQEPLILGTIDDPDSAMRLIASRLLEAYEKANFSPPYPTWPFTRQFFEEARDCYPRVLLQRCDSHRNKCVAENEVTEAKEFLPSRTIPPPEYDFKRLDGLYSDILRKTENVVFDENNEDNAISDLLRVALDCMIQENPVLEDVDAVIDTSFVSGRNFPVLNVRTRLIYRKEDDREKHLCLKALERTNAVAYQNRLKAAMTASGIDRALSFRKLMIVRTQKTPGGPVTEALTEKFTKAGGVFVNPTSDEFRILSALQELRKQNDPLFSAWLHHHRRVSALGFLQPATAWLFDDVSPNSNGQPKTVEVEKVSPPKENGFVGVVIKSVEPVLKKSSALPIGFRLIGKQTKELISIPVQDLTKHTVILAGSGSGKTVLVRRIVEEAALLGIPSIVIDAANDLARMGDRWPASPEAWREEDHKKADLYHEKSRVTLWTPGRESGNPLNLEPLPDLAPLINDEEELEQATTMALDSLRSLVAAGNSRAASLKQGVLKAALDYFARNAGGRLPELLTLLSDLPEEAGGGITDAAKKAREMADDLRAAMLKDPLLRQSGATIDPAVLFGLSLASAKTQVSIINFIGIQSTSAQQQFLNQLFMTLFTWIKRNPAPPENPVRGLLVLDEAKDIIPSTGSTPCKASLNRLAAQARKYGLGIIFATQAPKSIDHNIIANCSTQFYGRANSPASIDVIREQMRQRGGNGDDVARLERGQFYSVTESLKAPCKLSIPLCLSSHLPTPLDEVEVLKRAQGSRNAI